MATVETDGGDFLTVSLPFDLPLIPNEDLIDTIRLYLGRGTALESVSIAQLRQVCGVDATIVAEATTLTGAAAPLLYLTAQDGANVPGWYGRRSNGTYVPLGEEYAFNFVADAGAAETLDCSPITGALHHHVDLSVASTLTVSNLFRGAVAQFFIKNPTGGTLGLTWATDITYDQLGDFPPQVEDGETVHVVVSVDHEDGNDDGSTTRVLHITTKTAGVPA